MCSYTCNAISARVRIVVASVATFCVLRPAAFAVVPLDEDPWPQVTPQYLDEPFVDMKPFGTTMMNGILSVCENDARTHNGRMLVSHRYDQSLNAFQTVMKMRRDFAKASSPMLAGVTMEGPGGRFMGMPGTTVSPLFYPLRPDKVLGRYSDGNPGLAEIRQGKSTSIFYGGWQMDQAFIRDVLKKAGVFVYSDSNDPTEANEKLFTLHARYAGSKTVRLPRKTTVLDVFGRRIVARGVDSFEFDAKLHKTYLFYLSDDADALLEKLRKIDFSDIL